MCIFVAISCQVLQLVVPTSPNCETNFLHLIMIQVLKFKIPLYFVQYKQAYCIYNPDIQSTTQYSNCREDFDDKS